MNSENGSHHTRGSLPGPGPSTAVVYGDPIPLEASHTDESDPVLEFQGVIGTGGFSQVHKVFDLVDQMQF
jgi:hypothetical protein